MQCEICCKDYDPIDEHIPCKNNLCICPICIKNVDTKNCRIEKWLKNLEGNSSENSVEIFISSVKNEIFNYAKILFEDKEYIKAIRLFTIACQIDDSNLEPIYYRALSYYHSGKYVKAICDLTSIIQYNPTHLESLKLLGDCYLFDKDYSTAHHYYLRAFHLHPNDLSAKYMYTYCLLLLKRFKEALIYYEDLQEMDLPDYLITEINDDLCYLYFTTGNYEQALKQINKVLHDRHTSNGYLMKAEILNRLSINYDEIMDCLKKAIHLDGKNIQAYKLKAELVYETENNFSKYLELLKECLKIDPLINLNYLFDYKKYNKVTLV